MSVTINHYIIMISEGLKIGVFHWQGESPLHSSALPHIWPWIPWCYRM